MSEETGSTELIRYLLGELPEEQIEQIEQKYFSSDETFEEVEQAEAELIDMYVASSLDPQQKQKFEQLYLNSPSRRQRVRFAEALRVKAEEANLPVSPSAKGEWPVAAKLIAAAMVIFALAGAWLARELVRVQTENNAAREEIKKLRQTSGSSDKDSLARIEELTKELDKARMQEDPHPPKPIHGATPQPTLLAVVMQPGITRDAAGMQTLNVSRNIDFIRFELKLDRDPFPAYRVSLQTAGGDELWNLGFLKPSNTMNGKTILFDLPSGRVEARDYVLLLQGKSSGNKFENVSAYPFRVKKAQ